ncbi:MAG: 50S ribosomal protein L9 [Gammaproteobacteria bacterium RIFCSPHIGHO2_12_FULL_41_20]|nr:MAG: 50S ribosomal protein L9 [Gammaproteobacteria bacterium RIFCSPHIGHO2_12_FULL_41_20]
MEVILLEKIRNLGALGEQVKVKPGYARNFLIPQGKAVYATKDNVVKFEQRRVQLEKVAAERLQKALARQEAIHALAVITVTVKAGEEGKLFGSIGARDIAELVTKAGCAVEKREVRLSEGALRHVGEYEVIIDLDGDVAASVKLHIMPEAHA